MNRGLVIIDVQNIMFDYKEGVYNGKQVLSNIIGMIKKARDKKIPIIYIQHVLEDSILTTDTSGDWAIYSEVFPTAIDKVLQKRTCDSFHETQLHETLKELDIEEIIYVGMQTEFCVDTTCRRSFSMGYSNILISDAHSTFDTDVLTAEKIIAHHNNTLDGRFCKTLSYDDFSF